MQHQLLCPPNPLLRPRNNPAASGPQGNPGVSAQRPCHNERRTCVPRRPSVLHCLSASLPHSRFVYRNASTSRRERNLCFSRLHLHLQTKTPVTDRVARVALPEGSLQSSVDLNPNQNIPLASSLARAALRCGSDPLFVTPFPWQYVSFEAEFVACLP